MQMQMGLFSFQPTNPLFYFQDGPPLSLTLSLVCFCGMLLLILGVFVLGVIVRRDTSRNLDTKKDKEI